MLKLVGAELVFTEILKQVVHGEYLTKSPWGEESHPPNALGEAVAPRGQDNLPSIPPGLCRKLLYDLVQFWVL